VAGCRQVSSPQEFQSCRVVWGASSMRTSAPDLAVDDAAQSREASFARAHGFRRHQSPKLLSSADWEPRHRQYQILDFLPAALPRSKVGVAVKSAEQDPIIEVSSAPVSPRCRIYACVDRRY